MVECLETNIDFNSKTSNYFYKDEGIMIHLIVCHTTQYNGIAKMMNNTVLVRIESMVSHFCLRDLIRVKF